MSTDVPPPERLARLIDVRPDGDDRFTVDVSADIPDRIFGGMIAGWAVRAAQQTVAETRPVHSLHASFVRAGRPDTPVQLTVDRDSDGKAFSARRVVATQDGRTLLSALCSFHEPEPESPVLDPLPTGLPVPETLPEGEFTGAPTVIDVRPVFPEGADTTWAHLADRQWARLLGHAPADPRAHDALLPFLADLGTGWYFTKPADTWVGPSLDLSVWFHRRTHTGQWHFLHLEPMAAAGGRSVYRGRVWNQDGTHVASLTQESLLRTGPRPF